MIYLGCPYSHDNPEVMEQRFIAVNKVAARLMGDGLHVYSPISHTHPIVLQGDLPRDWKYWGAYDRTMLGLCTEFCIILNDGWDKSVGLREEMKIALDIGMAISTIKPGKHKRVLLPKVKGLDELLEKLGSR